MDIVAFLESALGLGDLGVEIAQIITALNPASWWASGVLTLVRMGLEAIAGLI